MLSPTDLHEYQHRAIDWIKSKRSCMLALDMGLGKTASTLTAISDLMDGFEVSKVLVIAPLRVANSVWPREIALWSHLSHLRVSVVTGTEKARRASLQRRADIYVINRENVKWLVENYGEMWDFDMVVVDESSSFKNSSSQRFKALKKMLPRIETMVLLTGTPSPNGLMDMWAQMYLIDQGKSLGRTKTGYKQRFFESDYMGWNWKLRDGAEEKIHALLDDRVIHMEGADYLELPDRIDIFETVDMGSRASADYEAFEREMLLELEEGVIEPLSAGALAGKLLQYANGAVYTDEVGSWAEVHKAKLDALADIVADNAGENILVAYNFKSDLARLQKRFPDAVVLDKKKETEDAWCAGEIPLMLAHPASAGHGLNLQSGGALVVWFGLNWSLELYQQFNARLHRQGQTRPVRIIHLVADGTIDERLIGVLRQKAATQSDLLKALKKEGEENE